MPRTRFNNGVLGPRQTTTASAAAGLFGLVDHQVLTGGGLFPRSPLPLTGDEFFPYVPLLINADSTNGATNNTFLDSSQNNTTLTPFGTMSQGSFSPFGDNWSNYFDGTGDYLSIADNAAFELGSNDFTIEMWIHTTSTNQYQTFVGKDSAAGTRGFILTSDTRSLIFAVAGAASVTTTGKFDVAKWNLLTITRSGNTIYLGINGTVESFSWTAAIPDASSPLTIASQLTPGSVYVNYFSGYISNLRIVNGSSVATYRSNFSVPTAPLTAIANTSLLTCQSNRFRDNSTNNFAITVAGDVSVQRFSPFSPATSYSTSTISGGLGKFVGSNYITLPSSNFAFGTASFTVELWLYYIPAETVASYGCFFDNGSQGVFLSFGTSKNNLLFYGTANNDTTGFPHGMAGNTWNHLAFVRNGTTMTIYVNGSSIGSWSGITGSSSPGSATAFVGTYSLAPVSYPCGGYIANMRVVNGVAVYTGNFTPPIAPLTTAGASSAACYPSTTNVNISFAASSTSLLLNGANSNIVDQAAMNLLGTIGQAQVSTAQSKFGGSSILFDGDQDYIRMPSSPMISNWFLGDYTIEYWIYPNAFNSSTNGGSNVFSQATPASTGEYFSFGPRASGVVVFYYYNGAAQTITSGSISTGTWTHLAATYEKSSNTLRIFINGTLTTSTTISGTPLLGPADATAPILVGASANAQFNGYIDDLRITSGIARYTSTFTPPTTNFALR
jgi:hypothetical protein